jgi:hypothetical protein
MSDRARVESVEALKTFRAALCKFAEAVKVGLGEAEADIQRMSFWLKQDQYNHWKRQLQKRSELYAQAKSALNRKKMMKTPLGGRYSYVDEEKALAAAQRRLEEAKEKLANVRRWRRLLDEESFTYKGVAQGMSAAVELDVPNALAQLDNMIDALEAYASAAAPGEQRSLAPELDAEEISRLEGVASMARETPLPAEPPADRYRRLRAHTPSRAIRDETPITAEAIGWAASDESGATVHDALTALDLARTGVVVDDKIVVARGIGQHGRIYLERMESAAAGDSGWYAGFADDTEVAGYDAMRIAGFLAGRPDLEAVLELPVGCLVVLSAASVEAVLDSRDRLLWPYERPMSSD